MWRSLWTKYDVMVERLEASSDAELPAYFTNDLLRRMCGIRDDGIRRLFESRELAGNQILLGKMPFSREHSL
jgi:hypothetical protein